MLASNPSCRLAGGRQEPGHLYRKCEEAWLQSGSEGRELTQPRTPQGQRTVTGKRPQLNMALSHKGDTDLQQTHLSTEVKRPVWHLPGVQGPMGASTAWPTPDQSKSKPLPPAALISPGHWP